MTTFLGVARRAGAWALLALAGACATVPPIDRYLLHAERAPVELKGAHGPIGHAQTEKIFAELRQKSPDTSIIDRHVAVEQALTGKPLSVGNRVTLLEDGKATYASMLEAIRRARSSIHLEVYIFEGGETGRQFADALIARRKAGVEVRVIYDSVGSLDTPKEFFDDMKAAGIEVVEYNPVSAANVLKKGLEIDHRDHRKLIVVDGRIGFLGGINISKVYGPAKRGPSGGKPSGGSRASGGSKEEDKDSDRAFLERPWRDTQVRIEGPVVADLQRIFLAQWARQRKEPALEGKRYFPALQNVGPEIVRAIEGSPDTGANAMYVDLISAIESAETDVRITNAYFVPHEELMASLKAAAGRGVDVSLILPSRTDSWLVLAAGHAYYDELLEAGVKIFEREGRLLHAKTATIDGVWSTVGSTNLDWRSLSHNEELNAVVLSPDFAKQMNAMFEDDLAHSKPITLEAWRSRPIEERMKEWSAQIWAYLL